jgi:hypothetical protein
LKNLDAIDASVYLHVEYHQAVDIEPFRTAAEIGNVQN